MQRVSPISNNVISRSISRIMWSAHVSCIDNLDMYSDHVKSNTLSMNHSGSFCKYWTPALLISKWRLASLYNWCATALNKQFSIPQTSNDLNPCLRNLSLNMESEPELHISLVDPLLFNFWCRTRIWYSIYSDTKICLSDELYVTVNILHFTKYLLWKLSCFLANLLFHCFQGLAMLFKTEETGADFLIKTLEFFLSFLRFSDLMILWMVLYLLLY